MAKMRLALAVSSFVALAACRTAPTTEHGPAASASIGPDLAALDAATTHQAPAPPAPGDAGGPSDPDAAIAPPSDSSSILKAGELRSKAAYAFQDRDGVGCLEKLDAADRMDPDPMRVSTNPRGFLTMRASCTMLAGKCELGKSLQRQAYTAMLKDMGPTHIDDAVESSVGTYCGDGAVTPRDKLLVAKSDLARANLKEDPEWCAKAHDRLMKAIASFGAPTNKRDEDLVASAKGTRPLGVMCVGAAGRCPQAFTLYETTVKADGQPVSRPAFEALAPACKGK